MAGHAFVSRFSPNRTNPKVLEAIFVQRHTLAEVWLGRLRDSVLDGAKHHLLAVGPRGCGKSHLVVLLVSRLREDPAVRERVRIAWLPEDETTPSFWKFLLRILRALNAQYGDEFPPPPREPLEGAADDRRAAVLTDYLLRKLGDRTLLVVIENLDEVMKGLKLEGQKRWRSFLQEHPVAATLATTQQLTKDMSDRDRPFFNFFQIERLQPLSADEALELLKKLADHGGNLELASFLQSATGRARVRAIRHIAGGGHRVFIILSEFATRENLDDLVTAFEELLDELTPYYQERLRWLPDQQREIIEFLCRQLKTVPVKKIAGELYLTEQVAASQLKALKDKGYVTAESVGRESRYELSEPLMRLCVEVKDPQREPIRLIVEFLRIWYDRSGVEARLQCLSADADMERRYLQAALQAHHSGVPGPVQDALNQDLRKARDAGDEVELARVLLDLAATSENVWECLPIAIELEGLGRYEEALATYNRATKLDPENSNVFDNLGSTLTNLGRHEEALIAFKRAVAIDPKDSNALSNLGLVLSRLDRHEEALAAYSRAIELDPENCAALHNRGSALTQVGRYKEALASFERSIQIDPKFAFAWDEKGWTLNYLGRHEEALAACDQAIELNSEYAPAWANRGRAKLRLGQIAGALEDLYHAITLDEKNSRTLESLAEAHVLQGEWEKAEQVLTKRFQLSTLARRTARFLFLPDLIATIFRVSSHRDVWASRVTRLAEIASEARYNNQRIKAQATPPVAEVIITAERPNPLAMLGDSLVRSLTSRAYAGASAEALDHWASTWQQVAERHTDLSLAVRIFGVGVRYVQTKDEKVLFDLVREERSILRELFGLSDGPQESWRWAPL